ncbi:PREDICTED: centromere protein W [Myotis brandtii]|uniref:centromere protein W n=1 Tax=Myotis brandtii TaxID=109478 RepID=UPI000703E2AF|nr:PREDICTED: centromere protein W [Myotis brandtii]
MRFSGQTTVWPIGPAASPSWRAAGRAAVKCMQSLHAERLEHAPPGRVNTASPVSPRGMPVVGAKSSLGKGDIHYGRVHLNCLLFIRRLAEEARTDACKNKCGIIKDQHVLAAAKVMLKKSRG